MAPSPANVDSVGHAMRLLREGLGPFVEQAVRGAGPTARLADFVRSNRLAAARIADFARSNRLEEKRIRQWDVAALLKFMQYMWNEMFRRMLGRSERALVSELQDWRNKWAHQEDFSTDDVDRTLDSAARLLRAVNAESQAVEVAALRKRLAEPRRTYIDAAPQVRVPPSSPQHKPAHGSQADAIRLYALAHYVAPWRESDADVLTIRAGDVEREMGLRNATPNVCSALEGGKFLALANLSLVGRDGPRRSTTTTYHYRRAR